MPKKIKDLSTETYIKYKYIFILKIFYFTLKSKIK